VTIRDVYLNSNGAYTLRVMDTGAFGLPTNITVRDVTIGPHYTSAPVLWSPDVNAYTVCNVWLDGGSLVAGVSACPEGGGVADFVAYTSTFPTGSTLTLTLPGAASDGDLLIASVFDESAQAVGGVTDNQPPAGGAWTLIGTNNSPVRTKDLAVWRKFVTGAETPGTTSYDFTGATTACVGSLAVYSGVDGTSPVAALQFSDDDTLDTNKVVTGTTTTEDNQRVVVICADQDVATLVPPGDLTERGQLGAARRMINTDKVQAVAGATGTFTFTSSVAQRSCGGVIVLENAPAPPPDAPGNPSATANSQTQITVDWDDVADETGFRVERSPDGVGSWADVSGNLAADTVSYADTGLTCNTQYFYRVVAFNGAGDSPPSTVVNATTNACTPGGGGNRMGGTGAIRKPPRRTSAR
jgi:hypothetical protein